MAAFLLAPKGLDLVHSVARLRLASSLTGQASSDEGAFRRFHMNKNPRRFTESRQHSIRSLPRRMFPAQFGSNIM